MLDSHDGDFGFPQVPMDIQAQFAERRQEAVARINAAKTALINRTSEIEEMIVGTCPVKA